jgi:hypothetical protein
VATLREYFFTEFRTGSTQFDHIVMPATGGSRVTVTARVHHDDIGYVRYVSYFVGEGQYSLPLAIFLAQTPNLVLDKADSVEMTFSHPAVHGPPTVSNSLPFSGRVFLYIDIVIPSAEKDTIIAAADSAGVNLIIKDRAYSNFQTVHEKPWAFISHDSRDKDQFVRELAGKLRSMMCPVWYDEYSLKVGDSVRESIDRGLSEAPKCILVLSPNFLSNAGWTKGEFNAAVNKHFSSGGSIVLPIWHAVSLPEVAAYSPLIADIAALKSDMGMNELCRRLFVAINPSK